METQGSPLIPTDEELLTTMRRLIGREDAAIKPYQEETIR